MSRFTKLAGTILLALLGCAGLLMSLCGGVMTVATFGDEYFAAIVWISVPSLLVGVALLWVAVRKLRRR
jgi:hypothetical protein